MFISPDATPTSAAIKEMLARLVRTECQGAGRSLRAYALVDAACDPELIDRLYAHADLRFDCALPGDVSPDEFHVAPFLVDLGPQLQALEIVLDPWLCAGCCLWLASARDSTDLQFDRLLALARSLSQARDETGHALRLRFWDPRVLPVLMANLPADAWAPCFSADPGLIAWLYPSLMGQQLLRSEWHEGQLQHSATSLGAQAQ